MKPTLKSLSETIAQHELDITALRKRDDQLCDHLNHDVKMLRERIEKLEDAPKPGRLVFFSLVFYTIPITLALAYNLTALSKDVVKILYDIDVIRNTQRGDVMYFQDLYTEIKNHYEN